MLLIRILESAELMPNQKPIAKNTLFYGDNLDILREYIPSESVDLVYLDPPFNSSRNYNVLFKDESGKDSESQITAFEDTWHWNLAAEQTYNELIINAPASTADMVKSLFEAIGRNQMTAYLVMMTTRLIELHRVLKPTGSLYLHCDPTASHYLKVILDSIFGPRNFRNEVIWQRTSSHNDSQRWGAVHDTIFYYGKTDKITWNQVFTEHDPKYIADFYRYKDERGAYRLDHIIRSASMGERPNLAYEYKGYTPQWGWRVVREKLEKLDKENRIQWSSTGRPYLKRYLSEQKGTPIKTVITDIQPIGAQAAERLGYPTQKPEKLLERIIQASSNEGDVILDPFAGCGTSVAAAQKLKRQWIGIDITHLSIALLKNRLKGQFNIAAPKDYQVIGEPEDEAAAHQLALDDRYQFQWWALSLVNAKPLGGDSGSKQGKKGSDKGIDGVINFIEGPNKAEKILVQVKSGHVKSGDIRDLSGTVQREKAAIGAFITLEPPTSEMNKEAVSAGFYHSLAWGKDFPKIQILTIADLLKHKAEIKMPPEWGTFKQAPKADQSAGQQGQFNL